MTREHITALAARFQDAVVAQSRNHPTHLAIKLATNDDPGAAEAYRLAGIGAMPTETLALSEGESLNALCERYAVEKQVSLREAVRAVGTARPDLVAIR